MNSKNFSVLIGLLLVAQQSLAGVVTGTDLGNPLGEVLSTTVGAILPQALGGALPLGMGGAAGIAAVGLIMGVQLIKRKKK